LCSNLELALVSENRSVRIFISSTFRDFSTERDLLVRQVFPALRARLQERFVELLDVDLRWGITAEQAERGEVLPICLAEINRSRPYFVGLLGERYGWTPAAEAYAPGLLEQESWLRQHLGSKSVTELEILHGVLNNPAMAGRALFYFRAPAYAEVRGGDYLPANALERAQQAALKDSIRAGRFPVVEDFPDPAALAERLTQDLWTVLDTAYPPEAVPDAFTRVARQHDAYAAPRRRLYLGGERYIDALNGAIVSHSRILIEGASGGGKSALLANWLSMWRVAHPQDLLHEHYLAATSDAAEPTALVRRLVNAIRRETGAEEAVADDPQKLIESLPTWLATANAHATRLGCRWIIAFDGLNGLTDLRDLRWLPGFLPERLHVVVTCLPGPVLDALNGNGSWHRIHVDPLNAAEREMLLVRYLGQYNKKLSEDQLQRVLSHPLASNPLFLRTLAEELRVFGVYEKLSARLQHYLASETVEDLFVRVLSRIEEDCESGQVRQAMAGMWASRSGLSEKEIQGFANLVPATWAPIRYAMSEALLETSGRLIFAHDYLRQAVTAFYLPEVEQQRESHRTLACWFSEQAVDARVAEELPWQWQRAEAWEELESCLVTRAVFEAIWETRVNNEQELLGYWLDLERRGRQIEDCYESAWKRWEKVEKTEPQWQSAERQLAWAKLAANLSEFLRSAGRYGELTTALVTTELKIRETVLGGEHIDTADSLNHYANLLRVKGDDRGALPYFRRALAIREKIQGPGHSDTIEGMRNLGATLRILGDYVEAELVLRQALEFKNKSPDAAPDDGQLLNSLAVLLAARGDPHGSEAMLRRALEAAERLKGAESPAAMLMLRNVGGAAADRGDLRGAESIYRRVLDVQERTLGENHPETISSLRRLASLLGDMGEFDRSEELFLRVLNVQEKNLGRDDHPQIAVTLNNFAKMLHTSAHYPKAVPLLRRAVKIEESVRGAEHPDTLAVMNSLAVLLSLTGDETGAAELQRRVLAIRERVLGPEHPDTANSIANFADTLERKGDVDGAIALLRRAASIQEKILGPEHPKLAVTLENLAGTLRDQGDLEGALLLQQRVLAVNEKIFGPDNQATSGSLANVAEILEKKGDHAGAEVLFRRALQIDIKVHGAESRQALQLLEKIADMLTAKGDYDEAEGLYRQELDITVRTKGPDHYDVAIVLIRLANVLYKKQDYGNIEAPARRALEIVDAVKGPEHQDTITCLDYLGLGLLASGDSEGAVPIGRRALLVREKTYGAVHEETAAAHSLLAKRLKKTDDPEGAEQHYRRALDIYEEIGRPLDTEVGEIISQLGSLCLDQDRLGEAEHWFRRAMLIEQEDQDAANTRLNLAKTIGFLAAQDRDQRKYEEAATLFQQALEISPRERDAKAWGTIQIWLGAVMSTLAEFGHSRARHKDAMNAYAAALDVWPEDALIRQRFDAALVAYEGA
jgi:tetratricopeptide (TPR) repeat protein